jgi:hypothetical protein
VSGRAALAIVALCTLSGCGLRHFARTVGEGNSELRVTLGGPLLAVPPGVAVPIPSIRIGSRYGLTDWLDIDSELVVDPVLLGVYAFDIGHVLQLYRDPNGAALSISGHLHVFVDLDDQATTRAMPEIGIHFEHTLERWLNFFGGAAFVAQTETPLGKAPGYFAPYLGLEAWFDANRPVRNGVELQVAWISPWEDFRAFATFEPAGYGAIVVVIGWRQLYAPTERSFP